MHIARAIVAASIRNLQSAETGDAGTPNASLQKNDVCLQALFNMPLLQAAGTCRLAYIRVINKVKRICREQWFGGR